MKTASSTTRRGANGFSITEATIVLSALSVLATTMAPSIQDYVSDAKMVKARSDVQTIACVFVRMIDHVGGAAARRDGGWATYELLAGAGEAPIATESETVDWTRTDDAVGSLDDHLLTNAPAYPGRRGPNMPGWRGAYLQAPVGADPWGARYAINVRAMTARGAHDTVVLSAGPDGEVTTPFARDGIATPGDDVIALVSSGGY